MKQCVECKKTKDVSEFDINSNNTPKKKCRECRSLNKQFKKTTPHQHTDSNPAPKQTSYSEDGDYLMTDYLDSFFFIFE